MSDAVNELKADSDKDSANGDSQEDIQKNAIEFSEDGLDEVHEKSSRDEDEKTIEISSDELNESTTEFVFIKSETDSDAAEAQQGSIIKEEQVEEYESTVETVKLETSLEEEEDEDEEKKVEQKTMETDETMDPLFSDPASEGQRGYACTHAGCSLRFSKSSRLAVHMRIHSGERPFPCDLCQNSYTRKAHLKRHIEKNHTTDKKSEEKFPCEECSKTFTLKDNLKKHMKRTHSENTFQCDKCDASFNKHRQLKAHKSVHGEVTTPDWKCEQCDKTFAYQSQWKRHQRVHDGYKCDICNVVMDKWSDLAMHKKICGKDGYSDKKSELLECDQCSKKIVARYMKMHKEVHDEYRPVIHCPIDNCPRYFYFLKNLKQHINSYHYGNRFPCPFSGCEQKLSSKQKMQQHMLVIHGAIERVKKPKKKPRRRRRDRGKVKKPMAAVITHVEVENGDELINRTVKQPLDDIEEIRKEAKDFVGSGVEANDSDNVFVGCRKGLHQKEEQAEDKGRVNPFAKILKIIEQGESLNKVMKENQANRMYAEHSSDTDTDAVLEEKICVTPDFSSFVRHDVP